jgi:hypothetical protein
MFKKRTVNPGGTNIRKRKSDIHDISEEVDEEEIERVKEIKQLQEMRVRKNGISIEELAHSDRSMREKVDAVERTVENMLGSQFEVRVDNLDSATPHKRLMEQFINEKLGLNSGK